MRASRKIDERFASPLHCQQACNMSALCSQHISPQAAKRDRIALHNSHIKNSSALARFGSSRIPVHHIRFTKPIVLVVKATSDIGSTVPPKPPASSVRKTGESEDPGRPRRLYLFVLANLHYLQELGVLLGIAAGAVYFVLNLMVNSKLESVEAKIEKLDAKVDAKIEKLDAKIDAKIEKLDAKIDKLDTRFDTLEAKVTTLIDSQKRRDLVTVGSSVLVSILATSFLQVSVKK